MDDLTRAVGAVRADYDRTRVPQPNAAPHPRENPQCGGSWQMLHARMNCSDTDRGLERSAERWKRGKGERTTHPTARIAEREHARARDDGQAFRGLLR